MRRDQLSAKQPVGYNFRPLKWKLKSYRNFWTLAQSYRFEMHSEMNVAWSPKTITYLSCKVFWQRMFQSFIRSFLWARLSPKYFNWFLIRTKGPLVIWKHQQLKYTSWFTSTLIIMLPMIINYLALETDMYVFYTILIDWVGTPNRKHLARGYNQGSYIFRQ